MPAVPPSPGPKPTTMNPPATSVDEYIAGHPAEIQALLRQVRATARQAAPDAVERISYRMPALFQQGVVVYYAAFRHHLGLYPPVADAALRARLAPFAGPKGNLRLPYDQPLPLDLIAAVVRSRLQANLARGGRGAAP